MRVLEVGVAAGREGAQQVERRGRLAVGLDLAARIGHARLRREVDVVDDVAAVARQLDAVDGLGRRTSAAWRTGRRCGRPSPPASAPAKVSTTAICRKTRKKSRMLSARMLGEALGAIAALEQEGLAGRDLGERAASACAPRLQKPAAESRRAAASTAVKRLEVRIGRHLLDRLVSPAIGRPPLAHDTNSRVLSSAVRTG